MMEMVLYNFLLDVPRATAIWIALLLCAAVALAGMLVQTRPGSAPAPSGGGPDNPDSGDAHGSAETTGALPRLAGRLVRITGVIPELPGRRGRLAAEAQEVTRYAQEVAVAAGRAAETARRRHAQWLAAQDAVDIAWDAFVVASAAADRIRSAAAFPAPVTPHTPAEYADRERYLHRAAMAAYWRREVSVRVLTDVLAGRNHWDPRRHPVEQERVLRTVIRDGRFAAYRTATDQERIAWHTAQVAGTASGSLRDEALVAAARARRLRRWLPSAAAQPSAGEMTVPVTIHSPAPVAWRNTSAIHAR